jgi:4-aminobutyrate aminotransferase
MWKFEGQTVPNLKMALPGPKARAILDRDAMFVSPSYTRDYPLVVKSGSGCVIEDLDGNLFLDLTAGIAVTSTGHCHPEVVAAIQDQSAKLLHMSGTDFYYEPQIDLAQKLAESAPGQSPKKVFFTNSGTEAIEAALKLSRYHTGRNRVVSFFGAFHGRTYGSMSLSGSKLVHRRGFSPLVPDVHHVPSFAKGCSSTCPQPAHGDGVGGRAGVCELTGGVCDVVRNIEDTIFKRICPPDEVAAIFAEPIQGEGGYQVAPPGCLPALRELCDKHGILLVLDEVQCGMGRTGKLFAHEYWGIEPDIVCLAKGIASGLPLGAIVAKGSVMDWPPGSHASTFGGNPVACRAALTTIELLEREYMGNAKARGDQLHAGLLALMKKHDYLANPRGLGLMRAIDVLNPRTRRPDGELRNRLVDRAFYHGLLLLGCGEAAIRFCPPLCISEREVETALTILDQVLAERPTSTVVA